MKTEGKREIGHESWATRLRQRDRSWAMRSATPMSFGSRTRMTAPISFGSRTRSILGGSVLGVDDLDGDASAGVQSQWWCDLGGTILAARTQRRDLVGAFGVRARSSSLSLLSLSLSLSLRICEPRNDLKVKQKLHSFFGSKALFYGQSK